MERRDIGKESFEGFHDFSCMCPKASVERAAVVYTLAQTARLNDIDPQNWLSDVLARLRQSEGGQILLNAGQ